MSTKTLSELQHQIHQLPNGGYVILLDTGALIDAEAEAMLQALHSRSSQGILDHLRILEERGAEKFMKNFYVGYGHKSIGDCGTVTIFIEGVSMLVAKAIQDWQLYSGQESSTRYIDFGAQRFHDPLETATSAEILEAWRTFYLDSREPLKGDLRQRFPRQDGENAETYEKAIAARSFDILRGFLPAGATTNLAWHTNLRQAADKLCLLRHHPLQEVRDVANGIEAVLKARYPSSFGHKQYEESERYYEEVMASLNYTTSDDLWNNIDPQISNREVRRWDYVITDGSISTDRLERYRHTMAIRPPKTELPKIIGECGTRRFVFPLDFVSFRDIQRHRAVIQTMPLLETKLGFEQWYLSELSKELRVKAVELIRYQEQLLSNLEMTHLLGVPNAESYLQYYIAMGYRTANCVTGTLPALVYLVELRATRFVHPTLRRRAIEMARILENEYGRYGLKLHLDPEPDRFDVRRGEHDIVLQKG